MNDLSLPLNFYNTLEPVSQNHFPWFDTPVLREPFTLREPQGERFFPNILSEVEGRAHHERKKSTISK